MPVPIPAYQMCPGGVAAVESRFSFVDLLLTFITIDIYTPRTYKICRVEASHEEAALPASLLLHRSHRLLPRRPSSCARPAPPAVASIHSLQLNLIDLIEISSPVDINAACGGNAIAIEDSDTIVSGIINIILGEFIPIFSVWDAGVDCAGGAPAAPPGAAPSGG